MPLPAASVTFGVGSGIGTPDYTSAATLIADMQSATWTYNIEVRFLWASSANEIDQNFFINGLTQAGYKLTFRAETGAAFGDNASRNSNRLAYNTAAGACIKRNVVFDVLGGRMDIVDLQIAGIGSNYYGTALAGTGTMLGRRLILERPGSGVLASFGYISDSTVLERCILISNGGTAFASTGGHGRGGILRHCTLWNRGTLSGSTAANLGATAVAYNTTFIGFETDCTTAMAGSHNATSNATAGNLPSSSIQTSVVASNVFMDVGASTYDLRPKVGSVKTINVGTDSNAVIPDILKNGKRGGGWDIGAAEYQSAPLAPDVLVVSSNDYSVDVGAPITISWTLSGDSPETTTVDINGDGIADWTGTAEQSAVVTYLDDGNFTVTVSASNSAGSDVGTSPVIVVTMPNGTDMGFGLGEASIIGTLTAGSGGGVTLAYARPDGDLTDGGWTNEAGSNVNLFASIDETVPSDTDFIRSSVNPVNDACEVSFTDLVDPATGDNHTFAYRAKKNGAATMQLTVQVRQGTTVIASFFHSDLPTTPTTYTRNLTTVEADAITNYADLRIRFIANKV